MFFRIAVSLSPTLYDSSTAHVTSCLIESNAFWKSMKQLYIRLFFLLAFSAISLSIKICCTVLHNAPKANVQVPRKDAGRAEHVRLVGQSMAASAFHLT